MNQNFFPKNKNGSPPSLSLDASRIAFIGIRDVDVPEREVIKELDIPSFPMKVVDRIGIRAVAMLTLER